MIEIKAFPSFITLNVDDPDYVTLYVQSGDTVALVLPSVKNNLENINVNNITADAIANTGRVFFWDGGWFYLTWLNVKATLKIYFDTLYSTFSGSWDDLSDKPSTFTPSLHGNGSHSIDLVGESGVIDAKDAKTTPVDADVMILEDSADLELGLKKPKKVTWANVKATLKTYFETLFAPVHNPIEISTDIEINSTNIATYNGSTLFLTSADANKNITVTKDCGITEDIAVGRCGNATATWVAGADVTIDGNKKTGEIGDFCVLTRIKNNHYRVVGGVA